MIRVASIVGIAALAVALLMARGIGVEAGGKHHKDKGHGEPTAERTYTHCKTPHEHRTATPTPEQSPTPPSRVVTATWTPTDVPSPTIPAPTETPTEAPTISPPTLRRQPGTPRIALPNTGSGGCLQNS